jgi:quercetin dioxygenase-like cupin family protein
VRRGFVDRQVRDELVAEPRTVTSGDGWHEELLGRVPEVYFEVRRVELAGAGVAARQSTGDRFHVLNVVAGTGVVVRSGGMEHVLNYAETIVVPAVVGDYEIVSVADEPTKVVKAVVA